MSTRHYTVTVTASDIAHGELGKCGACPVALALTRALGYAVHVTWRYDMSGYYAAFLPFAVVAHNATCLRNADTKPLVFTRLPDSCTDFISAYDDEEAVQPFAFDLDLVFV